MIEVFIDVFIVCWFYMFIHIVWQLYLNKKNPPELELGEITEEEYYQPYPPVAKINFKEAEALWHYYDQMSEDSFWYSYEKLIEKPIVGYDGCFISANIDLPIGIGENIILYKDTLENRYGNLENRYYAFKARYLGKYDDHIKIDIVEVGYIGYNYAPKRDTFITERGDLFYAPITDSRPRNIIHNIINPIIQSNNTIKMAVLQDNYMPLKHLNDLYNPIFTRKGRIL